MSQCMRAAWIGCHLLALVVLCPPLFGAEYYIDKGHAQASDLNIGSESQPWATIRKAIFVMGPGDTVYVKNGVYNEINDFMRSGAPACPSRSATTRAITLSSMEPARSMQPLTGQVPPETRRIG